MGSNINNSVNIHPSQRGVQQQELGPLGHIMLMASHHPYDTNSINASREHTNTLNVPSQPPKQEQQEQQEQAMGMCKTHSMSSSKRTLSLPDMLDAELAYRSQALQISNNDDNNGNDITSDDDGYDSMLQDKMDSAYDHAKASHLSHASDSSFSVSDESQLGSHTRASITQRNNDILFLPQADRPADKGVFLPSSLSTTTAYKGLVEMGSRKGEEVYFHNLNYYVLVEPKATYMQRVKNWWYKLTRVYNKGRSAELDEARKMEWDVKQEQVDKVIEEMDLESQTTTGTTTATATATNPSSITSSNPDEAVPQKIMGTEENSSLDTQAKVHRSLINVSGVVKPGEFLAICGPSGSGKTTLLKAILGIGGGTFTGQIQVSGEAPDKDTRRKLGYVLETDLFFPNLTVYEALLFTAQVRMAQKHPLQKDREDLVEMTIDRFGLRKIRNHAIKSLSTGEYKRVSVANELLSDPPILVLDEPTSSLDSYAAEMMISLLAQIAAEGKTVIITVHQPTSNMALAFNKLLMLYEGQVLYFGKADPKSVTSYLSRYGMRCPLGFNVIDYFMQLMMRNLHVNGVKVTDILIKAWQIERTEQKELAPRAEKHKKRKSRLDSFRDRKGSWSRNRHDSLSHQQHSASFGAGGQLPRRRNTWGVGDASMSDTELETVPSALATATGNTNQGLSAPCSPKAGPECSHEEAPTIHPQHAWRDIVSFSSLDHLHLPRHHSTSMDSMHVHPQESRRNLYRRTTLNHQNSGKRDPRSGKQQNGGGSGRLFEIAKSLGAKSEAEAADQQQPTNNIISLHALPSGVDVDSLLNEDNKGAKAWLGFEGNKDFEYAASWWKQFTALYIRAFTQRRRQVFSIYEFAMYAIITIFTLVSWLPMAFNEKYIGDRLGYLFFSSIFFQCVSIGQYLGTMPREAQVVKKERSSGYYRLSAYILAKTFSDLPIESIYPSAYVLITYYAVGMNPGAAHFFLFWFIVVLSVWATNSMSFFLICTTMNAGSAGVLVTITIWCSFILGGFYLSNTTLPPFLMGLRYLSWLEYTYSGLIQNEFATETVPCVPGYNSVYSDGGTECPITAEQVYAGKGLILNLPLWACVTILAGMVIGYRVLGFLLMKYRFKM